MRLLEQVLQHGATNDTYAGSQIQRGAWGAEIEDALFYVPLFPRNPTSAESRIFEA